MSEQSTPTADEQLLNQGLEDEGGNEGGAGDVLELGGEEAPEATPEEIEEQKREKRGRSWSQRVDNLTARLRDAERRAAELEARASGKTVEAEAPKAPKVDDKNADGSDRYEFGEADPQFIKDSALFEVKEALAKEREESGKVDAQTAAKQQVIDKLNEGQASVETTGREKYDDFDERIAEAAEARGEPLPALVGIAISVSPVGADIAYRLATDEEVTYRLEELAATNPHAAAIKFGELEGEYLDDDSDSDLNPSDPLDLARMLGRERARRKGGGGSARKVEVKTTKAPKAPEGRARGGSGQFEVSDDTDDFAAFEAKHMGKGK